MLAAAGWPLSELWDRKIASVLDLPPILDATNRAPSVLNGGLGKINPAYWIGCIALAAAVEGYGGMVNSKKAGYYPGDYGFDPFGLYPKDENGQARMRLSEIKNGRLAMVAITAFAAQEFVAGSAVIDHAAIFFKPITQVLADAEHSGLFSGLYVAPPVEEVQNAAIQTLEAAQSVVPPVETISEAVTAVVPPVETVSEAVTAVVPPVEAITEVVPPVDAVSAASVEAAAVVPPVPAAPVVAAPSAELIAAKERIVELEAKLSKIAEFSR